MLDPIEGQASPIEVKEWIAQNQKCYLLDVREPEVAKKQKIPPFQNVPAAKISKVIPQIDSDNMVFLLCQDGVESLKAQKILASCGIEALVVRGGASDWVKI